MEGLIEFIVLVWLAGWVISFAIFWIGMIVAKNRVFHSDLVAGFIACAIWPVTVYIIVKGK